MAAGAQSVRSPGQTDTTAFLYGSMRCFDRPAVLQHCKKCAAVYQGLPLRGQMPR